MSSEKIKGILGSNAGEKSDGVAEATDPIFLNIVQDERAVAALAGSDEMLGGKGGRPITLSFLSNAVCGVISNVGIIGLEGAAHSVEADTGDK